MKAFISWSGKASHDVALVLRDWLPTVVYTAETWVSSEDIEKGARWSTQLFKQLDETSCGIICITPTNIHSPWLNFEAGAISKSLEHGKIFPFLFGLSPSELTGPLSQFQVTLFQKEDVLKLIKSLNQASSPEIPLDRLYRAFEISWPNLQNSIAKIDVSEGIKNESVNTRKQPTSTGVTNLSITSAEIEVLKALTHETEMTRDRVMSDTQFPIMKTQHCLERLKDRNYVLRTAGGYWMITKEGTGLLLDNNLV